MLLGRLVFPIAFSLLAFSFGACNRSSTDATSDLSVETADLSGHPDLASVDLAAVPDLAGCPARQAWLEGACVRCDIVLPADTTSLADAVHLAPTPGVICLGPGSYTGNVMLRPHVSIVGAGRSTIIEGSLGIRQLPDDEPSPLILSDLYVRSPGFAVLPACPLDQPNCSSGVDCGGKTFALHLRRVLLQGTSVDSNYCGMLDLGLCNVDFAMQDSACRGSRGIRLRNPTLSKRTRIRFVVERSRFEPRSGTDQDIYDAIAFLPSGAGRSGDTVMEAGSMINATIRNNVFVRTSYQGINLAGVKLLPADEAVSAVDIRNNTFVSKDGRNLISKLGLSLGPPVLIANNLFYASSVPVDVVSPFVSQGNLTLPKDQSPFVDVATDDLRLKKDSPPVDTADESYPVAEDILGTRRPVNGHGFGRTLSDVGAYEYVPEKGPATLGIRSENREYAKDGKWPANRAR